MNIKPFGSRTDTLFDMSRCALCPRECNADRTLRRGICLCTDKMQISKIMLHHWEEPCISGGEKGNGSGAVFFGGCPLKCVFCQNKEISRCTENMREYSPAELAGEIKKLEAAGAYNINFVSPTQYTPQIIEALKLYRPKIPVVFNTGGYEKPETVSALKGYADIFLTDFKYFSPDIAKKYSGAENYPAYAEKSLEKMYEITGEATFTDNGMLKSGVIVRHLILPGCRKDSMAALKRVSEILPVKKIILSLMSQYTPDYAPDGIKSLKRRITAFEYESVRDYALTLGFEGYSQDILSARKSYTPDFNKEEQP